MEYERIEETEDPELAFDRAMKTYLKKGYSKDWINQRLKSVEVRKELTDEWQEKGMKEGRDFAILTNEITKAWTGKSVKELKEYKGLKKENLRDNMTNKQTSYRIYCLFVGDLISQLQGMAHLHHRRRWR